jgi:acetoin utilization deacetylase AcuC-like enzyme
MASLYITHDAFLHHDTGEWHPERAERLRAVEKALSTEPFQNLHRCEAPLAELDVLELVHPLKYIEAVKKAVPADDYAALDGGDTVISPGSWEAALRAVGAVQCAVDEIMAGKARNAFCNVRPPGHHAEPSRAMGFCLFNNIAIGAAYAVKKHGAARAAVVDFDVHHGNGTQAAFWHHPHLLYASTHQMPLFPGTGSVSERGASGNIVNAPLREGDGGAEFREAFETRILPALHQHAPDMLFISAGFDAHRSDPLASLNLVEEDFAWATRQLIEVARKHCRGRIVSVLEGGYDLTALARSAAAHVQALNEAY